MTPRLTSDEARKLLGGYATGTLTEAEREALFAAALEDQDLFNALAEEDALRELLESPGAKTKLLAALGESPAAETKTSRFWFGLPWLTSPRALSVASFAAVAVLTVAFLAQKPAMLPTHPLAENEGGRVAPSDQKQSASRSEPVPAPPKAAEEQPKAEATTRAKLATPKEADDRKRGPDAALGARREASGREAAGRDSGARDSAGRDSVARDKADAATSKKLADENRRTDAPAADARKAEEVRAGRTPAPPAKAPESKQPAEPKDAIERKSEQAASRPAPVPSAPPPPTPPQPVQGSVSGFRAGSGAAAPKSPSQGQGRQEQQNTQQPSATQQQQQRPPQQQQAQQQAAPSQQVQVTSSAATITVQEQSKEKSTDSATAGKAQGLAKSANAIAPRLRRGEVPFTLRYRFERPQGAADGAPPQLTVESSAPFIYVLRRTDSGWETVATGQGLHTLADRSEFVLISSRAALPEPASLVRGTPPPAARNVITESSDGSTTISSPESAVVVRLRIRGR